MGVFRTYPQYKHVDCHVGKTYETLNRRQAIAREYAGYGLAVPQNVNSDRRRDAQTMRETVGDIWRKG
jgi:hypothetical protein